jgi:hypothetical protein
VLCEVPEQGWGIAQIDCYRLSLTVCRSPQATDLQNEFSRTPVNKMIF